MSQERHFTWQKVKNNEWPRCMLFSGCLKTDTSNSVSQERHVTTEADLRSEEEQRSAWWSQWVMTITHWLPKTFSLHIGGNFLVAETRRQKSKGCLWLYQSFQEKLSPPTIYMSLIEILGQDFLPHKTHNVIVWWLGFSSHCSCNNGSLVCHSTPGC